MVMILGLVPTTVWAEDAVTESAANGAVIEHAAPEGGADTEDANTGGDGNAAVLEGGDAAAPKDKVPAPEGGDAAPESGDAAPENGVAPLADAASVVSVTISGETTEYSNIFRAFESVEKASSATVTLLDDVYLRENEERPTFPGKIELLNNVNITLNLNGYTITHADIGYTDYNTVEVIDMWAGTLTITGGGTIQGMYNTAAVSASGGTLTIETTESRSRASLPTVKRNSTVSKLPTKPAPSRSRAARLWSRAAPSRPPAVWRWSTKKVQSRSMAGASAA